MSEKYLLTKEFAERARTSESTIRYWRHTGYGPIGFRVGRRVLYVEAECDAWLSEQRRLSEAGRVA